MHAIYRTRQRTVRRIVRRMRQRRRKQRPQATSKRPTVRIKGPSYQPSVEVGRWLAGVWVVEGAVLALTLLTSVDTVTRRGTRMSIRTHCAGIMAPIGNGCRSGHPPMRSHLFASATMRGGVGRMRGVLGGGPGLT